MKFVVAILFIISSQAFGASAENSDVLSRYRVHALDKATLQKISEKFEVIGRLQDQNLEVIVPKAKAAELLHFAPQAQLLDDDMQASAQARLALYRGFSSFHSPFRATEHEARYHSFAEVQSWMRNLEATHPQIAKVVQYGTSQGGLPLLALRLTQDIQQNPTDRPELMITAATHGDELITTEVLMNLVDQILAGHDGANERLQNLIAKHDIYFIPVLNPDGFVRTERYDNGADPNRSYPYPGHENNQPTASIAGVISFFQSHRIVGSIDFHAYGELVMYPWGYTHSPVEKSAGDYFDRLTSNMAQTNHYTYGPIADVIYVAPGSSADFYFWKNRTIALGIEMGNDKIPDPSQFRSYYDSQTESTWRFIESF